MNRFRFVDDHRDLYEVKRLCQVLKINRSSYYAWKSAAPARRQRLVDDAVLGAQIKTTFNAENGCYGAKRVTAAINADPANDQRRTRGNPLAAGMIALGAGWLIGSLIPASRAEQDAASTVKDKAQPAMEEAKSAAQEMGEKLKPQAQEAADSLKGSAQDSMDRVKDEGQYRAQDLQEESQQAAQRVKDTTQDS